MPSETEAKEPENIETPDVDVGGKQTAADEIKVKKAELEELVNTNKALSEFRDTISPFMMKNEEGQYEWNINKIVEDLGYDPSALVKKGEKVSPPPSDPAPTDFMAEFKKDPKAFISSIAKSAVDEYKKSIEPEIGALKKDVHTRARLDMLAQVRDAHPDIDSVSDVLSKLISKKPPRDAEDLEHLYFAAKALKENGVNPGLGLSTLGLKKRPEDIAPPVSAEQQILDDIVKASGKSGEASKETEAARNIFGKSFVKPLKRTTE